MKNILDFSCKKVIIDNSKVEMLGSRKAESSYFKVT
mgnify:CR=1 FL=1